MFLLILTSTNTDTQQKHQQYVWKTCEGKTEMLRIFVLVLVPVMQTGAEGLS